MAKKEAIMLPSFFKEEEYDLPIKIITEDKISKSWKMSRCTNCGATQTSLNEICSSRCFNCGIKYEATVVDTQRVARESSVKVGVEDGKMKFVCFMRYFSDDFKTNTNKPFAFGEFSTDYFRAMEYSDEEKNWKEKALSKRRIEAVDSILANYKDLLKETFGASSFSEIANAIEKGKDLERQERKKKTPEGIFLTSLTKKNASNSRIGHFNRRFQTPTGCDICYYCPTTDVSFTISYPDEYQDVSECPCCKKSRIDWQWIFWDYEIIDGSFVMRLYSTSVDFNHDNFDSPLESKNVHEEMIVRLEKDKCSVFENSASKYAEPVWEKLRVPGLFFCVARTDIDDIVNAVKKSDLSDIGLVEFLLGGNKVNPEEILTFVRKLQKYPVLQTLTKSGFFTAADSMPDHPSSISDINIGGTSCSEILEVNDEQQVALAKMDLDWSFLLWMRKLVKAENSLMPEHLQEIKDLCDKYSIVYAVNCLTEIKTLSGISIVKALRYIKDIENLQYINRRDGMEVWLEYLRPAKKLGYDFSDEKVLFPNMLRFEVDKVKYLEKIEDERRKSDD